MKNTEWQIPADPERAEERLRRQARLLNVLWGVSLAVIGVGTFVISAASLAGIDLPDILVRILGIADLAALPVMVWAMVRRRGSPRWPGSARAGKPPQAERRTPPSARRAAESLVKRASAGSFPNAGSAGHQDEES